MMNAPVRISVFALISALFMACGGVSAGGSADADTTTDTDGSGTDAALDTAGDGGAEDTDDASDALLPDASDDADTSTTDISTDDAAETDTANPDDVDNTDAVDVAEVDVDDTDTADADTTDAEVADAAGDVADTNDGDVTDDTEADTTPGVCEFLDLDIRILDCNGDYKYLRGWSAPFDESGTCVPYFTISGDETQYATAEDAINTTDCSADCQYVASTSVSWIYCGRRSGYIIYRDADERCGELYEMPEGIYTSLEAHAAENPCEP